MYQLATPDSGISLRQLLPDAEILGRQDISIRSCCGTWSECQADDLYVAIVDPDAVMQRRLRYATREQADGTVGWRYDVAIRDQSRNGTGAPARGPMDIIIEGNKIVRVSSVGAPGTPINPDPRPKAARWNPEKAKGRLGPHALRVAFRLTAAHRSTSQAVRRTTFLGSRGASSSNRRT